MSKLDSYKSAIVSFFESALHIYPKDLMDYRANRANPNVEIIVPDELSKDYYRIRYQGFELLIKSNMLKVFTGVLETFDPNRMEELARLILSQTRQEMKIRPIVPTEVIGEIAFDEEYWKDVVGMNFEAIDKRFDGAFGLVKHEFEFIARMMTAAAPLYAADDSKAKTDDVFFFFNSKGEGKEFDVFLSPTLVPAVHGGAQIDTNREPMSAEDYARYFGYPTTNKEKAEQGITLGDEILASVERFNERVRELFDTELPTKYPACFDYLKSRINGILIPVIVTTRLECYSEFGGKLTNAELDEGTTANAIACAEIIDQEIMKIQKHLEGIVPPTDAGIDHYSIEVDSLGIYGRDKDNVVVHTVAEPGLMIEPVFMSTYSDGFKRVIHDYMKTIKNKYFFSMIGEVTERKEAEEAVDTLDTAEESKAE